MIWGRMARGEFDAWEKMGGPGWSWDAMLPYMKKVERVDPRVFEAPAEGALRHRDHYGTQGNVHVSQPAATLPYEAALYKSTVDVGLPGPTPSDPFGGDNTGGHLVLNSIDQSDRRGTRSYAVSAYLGTISHRPNLRILTEAYASRVILSDADGSGLRATGVEFEHAGQLYELHARREVLLCAGAIETPKLLELSGIGDPEILRSVGITPLVSNPEVGEHMQDHIATAQVFQLSPGEISADLFMDPEMAASAQKEYAESKTGPLAAGGNVIVPFSMVDLGDDKFRDLMRAKQQQQQQGAGAGRDEVAAQQAQNLQDRAGMDLCFIPLPFKTDMTKMHSFHGTFGHPYDGSCYATVCVQLRRSFSQGSVHVADKDFRVRPRIDARYLTDPADLAILARGHRLLNQVAQREPLASKIQRRVFPAEDVDVEGDDEALRRYILDHYNHEFHVCATAGLGRVVDPELKVIGVAGLRVVDASALPLLPTSNTQSVVYALAEKAADMIKGI
ncbi:hypothetical protein VTK73DRAFT_9969 [Phialemonium thermophilum]|uniref:Glucose-methanol-choline oxidoreductase N-terminal domain-containing protein n=1 Tax=Phialemonium thermophilum TaxID=223376 RepID=A0ABR3VZH0_9PEZI